MWLLHLGNVLMLAMMGAAAEAQPPRRPPDAADDRPAMQDGPHGRFGPGRGNRPPRGPGGPDAPPPVPWDRIPEPERRKINHFMEEHFPRMALELDGLRERAPRHYERRMTGVGAEMRRLMDILDHDPQHGLSMIRERQMAIQIRQLVMEYHHASDDNQRDALSRKIADVVAQEFQVRMERRGGDVRQMETKLAALKSRLSEMETLRNDIIARRVRDLLEKQPVFPPPDRPEGPADFDEADDSRDGGRDHKPIEQKP